MRVFISVVLLLETFLCVGMTLLAGPGEWWIGPFCAVLLVFFATAMSSRWVSLDRNVIKTRLGPFWMKSINVASIERVYYVKSNFRWGKEGWRIATDKQLTAFVSVVDPEEFFEELAKQAPHLHRYGDELRSSSNAAIGQNSAISG
jgi:hypothetical protein